MATMLVHCSAGVGRTGTLIALHRLMHDVDVANENRKRAGEEEEAMIDVYKTVLALRRDRVQMERHD